MNDRLKTLQQDLGTAAARARLWCCDQAACFEMSDAVRACMLDACIADIADRAIEDESWIPPLRDDYVKLAHCGAQWPAFACFPLRALAWAHMPLPGGRLIVLGAALRVTNCRRRTSVACRPSCGLQGLAVFAPSACWMAGRQCYVPSFGRFPHARTCDLTWRRCTRTCAAVTVFASNWIAGLLFPSSAVGAQHIMDASNLRRGSYASSMQARVSTHCITHFEASTWKKRIRLLAPPHCIACSLISA